MRFELGLLVMSMVTGCYATSSHEVKRGDTFSVPGAAPIFMTFEDVKTTRVTSLALTKDDELFDTWIGSETTRSYPVTLDPATGATRPLAWANGQLTPFYWDAHREILWVADRRDYSVIGLSTHGVEYPSGPWGTFVHDAALTMPLAFSRNRDEVRIWNAATDTDISVGADELGAVREDGSVLRLVTSTEEGGGIAVREIVIDWSTGKPVRSADVTWHSPPLDGARLGYGFTEDGRHVVEATQATTGEKRLVTHDLTTGAMEAHPLTLEGNPHIVSLGGSRMAVLERDDGASCWHGQIIDADTGVVALVAGDPCVEGVTKVSGLRYTPLTLANSGAAYFDPSRKAIVELGALSAITRIGPTTIAFARKEDTGYVIQRLDLATGALSDLAHRKGPPSTIHVEGDTLVLGEGSNLFRQRIGDPETTTIATPSTPTRGPAGVQRPDEVSGIGVRPERAKLWFGGAFGATTKGDFTADFSIHIRAWLDRQWAVEVGAAGLASYANSSDPPAYLTASATLSVYRFLRPAFGGWFARGGLRLGGGRERVDGVARGWTFAPTADASVGYQGGLFQLSLDVVPPTLLDPSRGVCVLAGLSIGLMGGNF